MAETNILVAKASAVIYHEGRQVGIRRGVTTIRAGHPLLATHADLFEPLAVTLDHTRGVASAPTVETSPSAPEGKPPAPTVKQSRRTR